MYEPGEYHSAKHGFMLVEREDDNNTRQDFSNAPFLINFQSDHMPYRPAFASHPNDEDARLDKMLIFLARGKHCPHPQSK